jgi:hypothetical protein
VRSFSRFIAIELGSFRMQWIFSAAELPRVRHISESIAEVRRLRLSIWSNSEFQPREREFARFVPWLNAGNPKFIRPLFDGKPPD